MAQETKKILSVQVEGQQSVKGLREEIKALRDALLNAEKGSDEYKNLVDKLVGSQQKLNEVMSVGKANGDAAAGSYNALAQEMSALKTVWKQVTDEGERDRLGQRIKEINDQLKDMDASIGNYQRNVGNYSGAWKQAGRLISTEIGKINPALGEIAKSITGMIPKITATTSAAKVGLNGVKAAIVSTGIGALIVGIGIALQGITKLFSTWIDKAKEMTPANRAAAESTRLLKEEYNSLNITMTETIRQFEEYYEIQDIYSDTNEDKIRLLNQRYEQANENLAQASAEYDKAIKKVEDYEKAHKKMSKQQEEEYEQLKKNTDAIKSNMDYWNKQADNAAKNIRLTIARMKKAQQDLANGNKTMADGITTTTDDILAGIKSIFDLVDEESKSDDKFYDIFELMLGREIPDALKITAKSYGVFYSDIRKVEDEYLGELKSFSDESIRLRNKISDRYQETLELLQESLNQGLISEQEYARLTVDLEENVNIQKLGLRELYLKKIAENHNQYNERIIKSNDYYYDIEQQQYITHNERLARISEEGVERENFIKTEADEQDIIRQKEINSNKLEVARDYYEDLNDIAIQNGIKPENSPQLLQAKAEYEELKKIYDKSEEQYEQYLTGRINAAKKAQEEELKLAIAGTMAIQLNLDYQGKRYTQEYEQNLAARLLLLKQYWENMYQYEGESAEEFARRENSVVAQINDLIVQLNGINTPMERVLSESEMRYTIWADNIRSAIDLVGDGLGNIVSGWETVLNAQRDAGEISEQEFNRQFENMKKLQIAQVVISTLSASVAAVAESIKSYGVPAGPIIGGALSASLLANGAAQIAAIKKAKPGNASLGSSGNYGNAQAQPTITEYTPERVSNQTGLNETTLLANALKDNPIQAWVVESSITAKQELANQRKNETTF